MKDKIDKKHQISVLKLDHRPFRDKRVTTHCALVSRAFNANRFYFTGLKDSKLINNIRDINKKWGGSFKIKYIKDTTKLIKNLKNKGYIIVHLTMYGIDIRKGIEKIKGKNKRKILLIIGGPKVKRKYYELSDYNISITNQPHSEISAITVFLYLFDPTCLDDKEYKDAKLKIIPNNKTKKVINLK